MKTSNAREGVRNVGGVDPVLEIARHRLIMQAQQDIDWPTFAGPAWRGAFGHALRKRACITKASNCAGCLFINRCAYPVLFETTPGDTPEFLRVYQDAPRPWILRPTKDSKTRKGQTVEIHVHVFESAQVHIPLIVSSLAQAAENGLTQIKAPLKLLAASALPCIDAPPPMPSGVQITIDTPVRVRRNRKEVCASNFQPGDLLMPLLRRIAQLRGAQRPLDLDFTRLRDQARALRWRRCQWNNTNEKRYSSRQSKSIPITGVTGTCELELTGLEEWWPLLWIGQWTHVGKGAVMGMGAYRLKIFDTGSFALHR